MIASITSVARSERVLTITIHSSARAMAPFHQYRLTIGPSR